MSVQAEAQVLTTSVPAVVLSQRQSGTLARAITHLLALPGLTVLVLVSAVVVLWTEPYPSMLLGVALLAGLGTGAGG